MVSIEFMKLGLLVDEEDAEASKLLVVIVLLISAEVLDAVVYVEERSFDVALELEEPGELVPNEDIVDVAILALEIHEFEKLSELVLPVEEVLVEEEVADTTVSDNDVELEIRPELVPDEGEVDELSLLVLDSSKLDEEPLEMLVLVLVIGLEDVELDDEGRVAWP